MSRMRHWLIMIVLSISGGIVFLLPFLQEVYYLPLVDAMGLSNTQVGSLLSVFGVTSMISYLPGGWLADRVSPRKLITTSLLLTGAAGFYFSTFPSYEISLAIHALWGVTIAFLFWGAMIRMTRSWASSKEQGKAFGVLETGRGIGEVGSSMAFLAVFGYLGADKFGLTVVIIMFSALITGLGILAWFVLEDSTGRDDSEEKQAVGLKDIFDVLRMPVIWLVSLVVLSGYCAYWGTFRFTSYATDIFGLSVTLAAMISVGKMWFKAPAALVAGLISDQFGIAKSVALLFVILVVTFGAFAVMPGGAGMIPLMLVNVSIASLAVFAMRGIYFALLEEGKVPMAVTGTAAGIVSVIGFTPDIFMPLLGGLLLDQFPGAEGYRYFFLTTAAICAVGLVAALAIYRLYVRKPEARGAAIAS